MCLHHSRLILQDIASDKLNKCTKVISVSEPVFDWLQDFNIPSVVIPNGIDYNIFYPKYLLVLENNCKYLKMHLLFYTPVEWHGERLMSVKMS